MFNFKLICIVIFLLSLREIKSEISDKKLCANENCTEPISLAKTVLRYSSPDRRILSFAANVDVTIYSKSAGSNMDLWGVEIKGRKGYAPKKFLRETRIFTKELPFLVNTELKDDQQVPSINSGVHETVKANKVPEYDIIDGTTIYLTSEESISPTPSESNIKPTVTSQNIDVLDVKTDEINTKEISQSMEENNILNDRASEINNKETEPLKLIKNVDKGKSKRNEMAGVDDEVKNKDKKTLVGNVIQSITEWMSDKEKDEFVTVDLEDENDSEEDDDDDDDYDDADDETDLEESEDVKESDVEVLEENGNNGEKTSDIADGNNKDTNNDNNKLDNNLSDSPEQKSNKETLPESLDTEEILNLKEVNIENNVVKTRQLLSDKETSDNISANQVSHNKETTQNQEDKNTEVKQESGPDNVSNIDLNLQEANENTTVNTKQCSDENCLKGSENEFKTPTSEQETLESVTESAYTEIPGFEIPVPHSSDFVTPNPIENDQSSSADSNSNTPKEEEKMGQNIVVDDKSVVLEQTENLEAGKNEAVENLEIKSGDSDQNEEDKENISVENVINLQSSSSPENNDVNVSKEQSNHLTVNETEIKSVEAESSNNNEDVIITTANIEGLLESEKLNDITENSPEEITVSSRDNNENTQSSVEINQENSETIIETNSDILSDITTWLSDQDNNGSTQSSAETNQQQQNSQTIKNDDGTNSYILSDVTNWLANQQNGQVVELASESEMSQNNTNENVKEESEELKQTVVESESMETIEMHEHSFLSMISEPKESVSGETEQGNIIENLVSETSENTEEADTEVLENQEIRSEEFSNQEEAQESSHVFDVHDPLFSKNSNDYGSCPAGESDCPADISVIQKQLEMEQVSSSLNLNFSDFLNLLTVLGVTGLSVVIFLLGYITIDKNRKEGPLIAKINNLEKALLVTTKENALLIDRVSEIQNETAMENDRISSEELENLNRTYQETLATKSILEDQVQSLEKELENSTEVGLELNRLLSDILSSQNGSEILIANVEQLRRQLVEQQGTINSINDTLNLKDTENHELQLELEIKNKKVTHLQTELDKMAMNLFKVEEDKEQMQAKLENEIIELKDQFEKSKNAFNSTRTKLVDEMNTLKGKYSEMQRNLELKTNEYSILKENFNQIKTIKNNTEALESLLNASSTKAELQQLQRESQALNDLVRQEQQTKFTLEKQIEIALQEAQSYKAKYDDSDKQKLEAQTKLEVLSNYFKEKEAQLQKELSKHESMWVEQQGEATSTVERIKYMQEELQNCKSQNELLKQEIISQEVELKSQISVLEKKAHENWVSARQAERRLEDAKQEAAQLRNKLTLKERSFIEDKSQNRIQSPLEQNGDVAISPLHMPVDSPASPPLLYGTRDHLTTSPPLPNLPPFLPPPPGVPFMPPPIPGVPGFMPPPPSMFPVDHRPPPLGRMSSMPPPLNSRYSPDSRYSPYDRNSPSPPYDDEYGSSPPPMHRGYSPYDNRDDRRDYKRPLPPVRTNGRKKGAISSGSGNSNESLEKINRHHSKV